MFNKLCGFSFLLLSFFMTCLTRICADQTEISLQSGDFIVRFSVIKDYSITAIDYQLTPLLAKNGANGYILSLPGGQMLGAGYKTADTAEKIEKITLLIDKKEQKLNAKHFKGEELTLHKESVLGAFRFFSTYTLNKIGLTYKIRYEYEKEQNLNYFYPFVLGWRADVNEYIYCINEKTTNGKFNSDGNWQINSNIQWLALLFEKEDIAVITAYSNNFPLVQRQNTIWDHKAYKKNYIFHKIPDFQKDKKSEEFIIHISAFQVKKEEWQKESIARSKDIFEKNSLLLSKKTKTLRKLNSFIPPDYGDISNEDWATKRRGIEALHGDYVLPPFEDLQINPKGTKLWNRYYELAHNGLLKKALIAEQDFFSRPMTLTIIADGEEIKFETGEGKLLEKWKGRAVYEHRLYSKMLDLTSTTTIEYDGMVKIDLNLIPKGKVKLQKFSYAFHLPKKNAKFIHFIGCPSANNISIMVPKESFSFAVPNKEGVFFSEPFKTLVWLGNNDQGFLWFCASEQHWSPQEVVERPAALQAISKNGEVSFIVNPVSSDYEINDKISYTFGFFATPVRPMPEKWRSWLFTTRKANYGSETEHGYVGNMPMIWPDEFGGMTYPRIQQKYKEKIKGFIDELHSEGRNALTYCDPIRVKIGNLKYLDEQPNNVQLNDLFLAEGSAEDDAFIYRIPELAENLLQWKTMPELIYAYGAANGGREARVSSASGWADLFCFLLEKFAEMGLDGFGDIDNCFPIRDQNELHGAGYVNQHGVRCWEWDWFARRDLMKRLAATFLKVRNGKPAILVAHSSATWSIPFISFCDANLIFEHSNSGYYSNKSFLSKYCAYNEEISEDLKNGGTKFLRWAFPKERWQAELSGKQFGLPAVIMGNLSKSPQIDKKHANSIEAARELGAFILAHDTITWPIWCNTAPLIEIVKIKELFGIAEDDVEFLPYWDSNNPVLSSCENLSISLYNRKDRSLIAVCNLSELDSYASLDLSALKPKQLFNAETNQELELKEQSCNVFVPARNYRLLTIQK